MIRTILILTIVALSVCVLDEVEHRKTSAAESSIPKECPTITVECPNADGEIAFIASVKGEDPKVKLRYQWSITRGEIKSGQGTAKITLKAQRDGSGIGASVEVIGLTADCANKASCYTSHF